MKKQDMYAMIYDGKKSNSKTEDSVINLEMKITESLKEIGVPAHIKGYKYLKTAIKEVVFNFDLLGGITKELYPKVANEYSTTSSRVERSIRHAIEVTCSRGEIETINVIFGCTLQSNKGRPTNSEFIAILADRFRYD